mmetsp:Transcript_7986/g.24574  ORF Transcript_7986/g.24574 Transcript_7986/m.24574 type:complete len:495 (-) Transcript_7986:243-1727(-)
MINEQVVVREAGREAIAEFLRSRTCFELIRASGKVVVFETNIPIQLAFYALLEHEMMAAPLWDSRRREFAGLMTITDFVDVLRWYHDNHGRNGSAIEGLAARSLSQVLEDEGAGVLFTHATEARRGEERQEPQQQQQQQHKPSEEVMRSLLGALKRKKDLCFYFLEPVDPVALRLPDYRDVIKRPMDLGTIESKLSSYETLDAFAADVRLVFTNAMTYNKSPKLAVHDAAKRLLHLFELRLAKAIKTTDLVVDVEDEPPPVEEEEEEEERPQKKRPGTKKRPHAPKATTTTEKEKPHLVVQKVSKLSAPGSKKKKEHPPLARSQTPQPVSPEPRLEVVDLSFIPTLIPVAPSAEDPPTRLDAWDLDALARDEETKRDEAPTALWETARAEAGRRREREDLEARRRTAHLAEARKLEKRRRQEQLAELERRRRRDEEEQRRLQEERDKEQRDADQKRQIEREQARRDREKLARTEDLDRKHTALASYIDNLEHFD